MAGTGSGVGKTTISLGLMAALKRRGLSVAPFKVGPDFIDPGHHSRVCGVASCNLDGWMLSEAFNRRTFFKNAADADVAVVEGVMGLFDGYDGKSEAGSTAQMAKWLGLPVVLAVNARSMARSAAALVQGFERFDPDLKFAGVVFNQVGSDTHVRYLREALDGNAAMPCLGGIARSAEIAMPERHLGLVTADDHPLSTDGVNRLADLIENSLDVDALLAGLPELPMAAAARSLTTRDQRAVVAVARDAAFCFYYPENIELLAAAGARIAYFSPLTDSALPKDSSGIYLGGGYPELHAQALAENSAMRTAVADASAVGMPVYAECGGFMYLCRELTDTEGRRHPMCGCFPFEARMSGRLRSLGYREVTCTTDTLVGAAGTVIRGHEFHYSEADTPPGVWASDYRLSARSGNHVTNEGYRVANTLGSYVHLHFGSRPDAAETFVSRCEAWQRQGTIS
ncbi:MAG: cobyrinate a,c-diamide synthase [Pseudomonadota bacterium]